MSISLLAGREGLLKVIEIEFITLDTNEPTQILRFRPLFEKTEQHLESMFLN